MLLLDRPLCGGLSTFKDFQSTLLKRILIRLGTRFYTADRGPAQIAGRLPARRISAAWASWVAVGLEIHDLCVHVIDGKPAV